MTSSVQDVKELAKWIASIVGLDTIPQCGGIHLLLVNIH